MFGCLLVVVLLLFGYRLCRVFGYASLEMDLLRRVCSSFRPAALSPGVSLCRVLVIAVFALLLGCSVASGDCASCASVMMCIDEFGSSRLAVNLAMSFPRPAAWPPGWYEFHRGGALSRLCLLGRVLRSVLRLGMSWRLEIWWMRVRFWCVCLCVLLCQVRLMILVLGLVPLVRLLCSAGADAPLGVSPLALLRL